MPTNTLVSEQISYSDTNSFTSIAVDLHGESDRLTPFVSRFFSLKNFGAQMDEKQKAPVNRQLLVNVFTEQYSGIKISPAVKNNVSLLGENNTYTITTGHQLCLLTGPLYFVYKIIHVIKLAEQLKAEYPENNFVPVFWMASEDHDFAEVASAKVNGERISWDINSNQAPVGRLKLDNISATLQQLKSALGEGPKATELCNLAARFYQPEYTLSQATRLLANELFGKYGLLILDADHAELKRSFIPVIKKDLFEQIPFTTVSKTTEKLTKHYKAQIHPRESNFFFFKDGVRRRIDKTADGFSLADTDIHFSSEELLTELNNHPENFSPNVVMRPVYQEFILPNLVYVGGGGEQAYWLQLKSMFDQLEIPFPMLALRNSVMLVGEEERQLLEKLKLTITEAFEPEQQLAKRLVKQYDAESFVSLATETKQLNLIFANLQSTIGEKDASLEKHLLAQLKRQEKFFQSLESKLVRVGKLKHRSTLNHLTRLKQNLFPKGGLQERSDNIFTFLFRYPNIIEVLMSELNPENPGFTVVNL